jgi:hypothetical protein
MTISASSMISSMKTLSSPALIAALLPAAIQVRAPLEPAVGGFVYGDQIFGNVGPLFSEYSFGFSVHRRSLDAAVWPPGMDIYGQTWTQSQWVSRVWAEIFCRNFGGIFRR